MTQRSSGESDGISTPIGEGSTPSAESILPDPDAPTLTILWPDPKWWLEITPEFKIAHNERPNWFHRTMMSLVFGWKWRPYS